MHTKVRICRALRRVVAVSAAAAVVAPAMALSLPVHAASATSQGNLLVSTSSYNDVPAVTAGSTLLPIAPQAWNISVVTFSAGTPNTAQITTTKSNGFIVGETVTIAGAPSGETALNGSQTVTAVTPAAIGAPVQFTISLGSNTITSCTGSTTPKCAGTVTGNTYAVANGTYPQVFNNADVDGNFGITEPIILDEVPATIPATPYTPSQFVSQTTVPNSDMTPAPANQLVTSFPSKSELALNQSPDGNYVSFMGYHAATAAIDVSNSNTPNEIDTTNTDTAPGTSGTGYYRDAATLDGTGAFTFTETGAYGGNNGRAAVLNPSTNTFFLAGNAGNGANPPFRGVVTGAGSQIATWAGTTSQATQDAAPPAPTPFGNFNIVEGAYAADKSTKDDNFRGLTLNNGVIYLAKGSGGNGINTVYFVDTSGGACAGEGNAAGANLAAASGLPQPGATLPSAGSWTPPAFNTSNTSLGLNATKNPGLAPTNMCILNGFPNQLATVPTGQSYTVYYPFGMWFANATTLYVADEGSGAGDSTDTTGGLQKWTFDGAKWNLQYTLSSGLNLKTAYAAINPSPPGVNGNPAGGDTYPSGTDNGAKGGSWTPANDGLRNITGRVNGDGTVTIWGVTSTISGSGDQGADPNEVVAVTDTVANTTPTASFSVVLPPTDGVVYRGVSFTPLTPVPNVVPEAPWLPLLPLSVAVLGGGAYVVRRRRRLLIAA